MHGVADGPVGRCRREQRELGGKALRRGRSVSRSMAADAERAAGRRGDRKRPRSAGLHVGFLAREGHALGRRVHVKRQWCYGSERELQLRECLRDAAFAGRRCSGAWECAGQAEVDARCSARRGECARTDDDGGGRKQVGTLIQRQRPEGLAGEAEIRRGLGDRVTRTCLRDCRIGLDIRLRASRIEIDIDLRVGNFRRHLLGADQADRSAAAERRAMRGRAQALFKHQQLAL